MRYEQSDVQNVTTSSIRRYSRGTGHTMVSFRDGYIACSCGNTYPKRYEQRDIVVITSPLGFDDHVNNILVCFRDGSSWCSCGTQLDLPMDERSTFGQEDEG